MRSHFICRSFEDALEGSAPDRLLEISGRRTDEWARDWKLEMEERGLNSKCKCAGSKALSCRAD